MSYGLVNLSSLCFGGCILFLRGTLGPADEVFPSMTGWHGDTGLSVRLYQGLRWSLSLLPPQNDKEKNYVTCSGADRKGLGGGTLL